MSKTPTALRIAIVATSLLLTVTVAAQPRLETSKTAGGKVIARDSIAKSPTRKVRVAGEGTRAVQDIAAQVFVKPRALATKLTAAKATLLAPPVTDERFVETERATLFVSTTSMTVTDPAGLRSKVPEFKSYHSGMKDRGTLRAADLKGDAKQGFEAFKASLAGKPANHPLKVALAAGDDALLDAIAQGLGDVVVTITASVPKESLPVKAGALQKPRMKEGAFDFDAVDPFSTKLTPAGTMDPFANIPLTAVVREADFDPGPAGKKKFTANFVTGFTKDHDFEWEERWDFPSGFFSIGVGAYYAFGLRVPVEVTATLDPVEITKLGTEDTAALASTTITAKPVNGDKAFYTAAGMAASEAHGGEELLLEAGAYAHVRVNAGWGIINVNETFPKNLGFDFSKDFDPPFGNCGTDCGFDVWIPSSLTHTGINVIGIVEGSAQVGFNISGKGTVGMDYTSFFDGKAFESQWKSKATTHRLTFDGPTSEVVRTTLPALPSPDTEAFGYRIGAPTYDWRVTITPGVKGTVEVNAKPFFKIEETIGPFWLPFLDINLGTVKLAAHKGTTKTYTNEPGRKTLKVLTATKATAPPPGSVTPRPR